MESINEDFCWYSRQALATQALARATRIVAVGYNWSTGTHEPSFFVSKLLLRRREFYEKYRHDERMKLTDIVRYLPFVVLVLLACCSSPGEDSVV
jgi:hypothetical protein